MTLWLKRRVSKERLTVVPAVLSNKKLSDLKRVSNENKAELRHYSLTVLQSNRKTVKPESNSQESGVRIKRYYGITA